MTRLRNSLLLFLFWFCGNSMLYGQDNEIAWHKKANFGNEKVTGSVAFSVGKNAYLYNGADGNVLLKYDSKADAWKKMSDFPGPARTYAVAFTIGDMAYLATGSHKLNDSVNDLKDIWQYDPAGDKWKQMSDFPGGIRHGAIAFSIGGFGYIGLGAAPGTANSYTDLWKYDSKKDTWTKMADIPELGKVSSSVFTINDEAYVLFGNAGMKFAEDENTVYKYSAANNSWAKNPDFPGTVKSAGCCVFSLDDKGYIVSANNYGARSYFDIWEYTPQAVVWKQEKTCQLPKIATRPFCFVIDTQAFVGNGHAKNSLSSDSSFGCISVIPGGEFKAKLLYKNKDRKVPLASQKLSLVSEKKVLQTTITDSNGLFGFKKIDTRDKYEVVLDKNPAIPDNAVVSIAKPSGKIMQELKKNEDDQFYYEVSKLDYMNEDDSYFNLQNFMKSGDTTLTVTAHINYATNSWELTSESQELLYEVIVSLKQYPNLKVYISSHTDAVGSEEENMILSEKRAKTVVLYIVSNGVKQEKVSGKGYGSTKLLNKCGHGVKCSEEENMVNRRTEFTFSKQ